MSGAVGPFGRHISVPNALHILCHQPTKNRLTKICLSMPSQCKHGWSHEMGTCIRRNCKRQVFPPAFARFITYRCLKLGTPFHITSYTNIVSFANYFSEHSQKPFFLKLTYHALDFLKIFPSFLDLFCILQYYSTRYWKVSVSRTHKTPHTFLLLYSFMFPLSFRFVPIQNLAFATSCTVSFLKVKFFYDSFYCQFVFSACAIDIYLALRASNTLLRRW